MSRHGDRQPDEKELGTDPANVHRAGELPSALRTDKIGKPDFEAVRSQQAQNSVLNPGRQKR